MIYIILRNNLKRDIIDNYYRDELFKIKFLIKNN